MIDALTLDQLRTFVAVAEAGSFRAGAARLMRAQSAVSGAIANLEALLGVRLFDRSVRRPVLTPDGELLLANARDILLRVSALRARARGLSEGLERELSLSVDTLFPLSVVGAALVHVRSLFPSVALRLEAAPLGGPVAALRGKRSTLAILVGEDFRDPTLELEAVASVEQVAVVSPDHPLGSRAVGSPIGLAEMADHLQIVLSDPTPLSDGRTFGVLSPQMCRVGSQDVKHSLILAGLGWGRLPAWQVADDLCEGRLVRLKTAALGRDSRLTSEVYLARRLDEPFGPAARAFRTALIGCLADAGEAGALRGEDDGRQGAGSPAPPS
ncbi:MAG TPA: LysR family transcriptional regulator [Azospirillaceae bacterium]|nr:LysR family transcriptional regulator [Azospirillaceae bacterium]